MAEALAVEAEGGEVLVNQGLPETAPTIPNPGPWVGFLGDVDQHTNSSRMGAGAAEGVAIHLQRGAKASGDGEKHGFVVEVCRESWHLDPDRDNRRIFICREVNRPLEEGEWTALDMEGLFEKNLKVILFAVETEK